MSLLAGEAADAVLKTAPASVLARVTGARKGAIVDGLLDDDACDRMLALIEKAGEIPTSLGIIEGIGAGRHAQRRPVPLELPEPRRWVRGTGDQSNSVAFVGDRYVLKAFRRIEPMPNPELEIGRFLTERGSRDAAVAGALQYRGQTRAGKIVVGRGWSSTRTGGRTLLRIARYTEVSPRATFRGPASRSSRCRASAVFAALEHVSLRRGDASAAVLRTARTLSWRIRVCPEPL